MRRAKERREAEEAAAAMQAMQAQQEEEAAARAAAARDLTPAVRAPVEAPSSMQETGPIFGELPAVPYPPCPTRPAAPAWPHCPCPHRAMLVVVAMVRASLGLEHVLCVADGQRPACSSSSFALVLKLDLRV